MAKTNRPRRRMDRYFKNLQKNAYILSYNKKGSSSTKIKKWDVIRRLTKKLITEEEQTSRVPTEPRSLDPGVQLLPRQDVMLYGTIPAMEQRVYSKCKNCSRVFNPRDIQSHRSCSKVHTPHSLLKKKVKSKSGNGKVPSSNGNSNSPTINSPIVSVSTTPAVKDPIKDFEFKSPYTRPPIKAAAAVTIGTAASSTPQLKVSVTKIGITKVTKTTPETTSTSVLTSTTSSDKSDSKVSSSKVTSSVHHNPKSPSSSGYHSSKSSGHSPRSSSSASSSPGHHGPKSPSSSHHSPKSPSSSSSSHHRSKNPSSGHHSPRSPSKSSSSHHGSSHHSSSTSHHSSSKSSLSKATPMDTLPPSSSSSSSHHYHSSSTSSHSSSRHKKSSSSSSKRSSGSSSSSSSNTTKGLPKNYDPDIHCGVTEGSRGPCMRSITCSNHRLHLRKQVSGRSKDIHQLIAERKAAKENDLKHTTPSCSYTSPNGEAKDIFSPNTSYVPAVGPVVSTSIDSSVKSSFVPIMPRVLGHQTRLSTTSVLSKKSTATESEIDSAKALTNGYMSRSKNLENTPDSVVGTVPVVIMPVSPVSVVSSVQLLKIGNNIISLESPQSATSPSVKKQMVLPIPSNHTNGVRMYKSHPKPIVVPNFGARRLGGAILLANPLLEDQRNDLLTTIDFKLETVNIERGLSGLNHGNSPHRPNILKGKGGMKSNCKRPATDKLVTVDSKRLVPDVNGFILHADVSETADAPQYSGENGPSQHELIISLIDKYGF